MRQITPLPAFANNSSGKGNDNVVMTIFAKVNGRNGFDMEHSEDRDEQPVWPDRLSNIYGMLPCIKYFVIP